MLSEGITNAIEGGHPVLTGGNHRINWDSRAIWVSRANWGQPALTGRHTKLLGAHFVLTGGPLGPAGVTHH